MYLRITQRQNRDGSTVAYYALAESVWNADAKQPQARVIHSFGRADQLDRAALERLVRSINRVLDMVDCCSPAVLGLSPYLSNSRIPCVRARSAASQRLVCGIGCAPTDR